MPSSVKFTAVSLHPFANGDPLDHGPASAHRSESSDVRSSLNDVDASAPRGKFDASAKEVNNEEGDRDDTMIMQELTMAVIFCSAAGNSK